MHAVMDKDTKVMSMHLHEKLSGNQHAESLRRKHLECWDLHVGAKLNVLGRPTTLMQANLVTGKWLEYQGERLLRIKSALEVRPSATRRIASLQFGSAACSRCESAISE